MELLFRVWDNVDYMSSPFTFQDLQLRKIEFTSDCPVMQFTGLKDKNGIEIFEGDIVKDDKTVYKVIWHQQQTCFWLDPIESLIGEDWVLLVINNSQLGNGYLSRKDLEIIGNVYQNSELLKA